ncbi:MAG: terminase large subunit domain-containing protein [Anaerolineae bacterium]
MTIAERVRETINGFPRPAFAGWHRISLAEKVSKMGAECYLALLQILSAKALLLLLKSWLFMARPAQLPPPGDWYTWLIQAGRGFGKTKAGACWIIEMARKNPGKTGALVGRSWKDVRQTMVEGPSGVLANCPPDFKPDWKPVLGELHFPNGCVVLCYAATEPDQLRGPNLAFAWLDEYAAWAYPWEAINNLWDTLRGGRKPQCLVTTTPRGTTAMQQLLDSPDLVITRGSSLDNAAHLPPSYLRNRVGSQRGTARWRQEALGEMVTVVPGALWCREDFEQAGFRRGKCNDEFDRVGNRTILKATTIPVEKRRVVVGCDPQAVHGVGCTGIVAAALGADGRGYVLRDGSDDYTPDGWCAALWEIWDVEQADVIVLDTAHGGDMVENTLRQWCKANGKRMPLVKRADNRRGKYSRVQPFVAFYRTPEGTTVHHIPGLDELENEQRTWVPGEDPKYSPHRIDALGYALGELFPSAEPQPAPAGGFIDPPKTHRPGHGSMAAERKSRWQTRRRDGIETVPSRDRPAALRLATEADRPRAPRGPEPAGCPRRRQRLAA